jgi:hypothetical protein
MLDSAHITIVTTLVNQRINAIDAENTSHLPKSIQDAVSHEYVNLIELREWLANHADRTFTTTKVDIC